MTTFLRSMFAIGGPATIGSMPPQWRHGVAVTGATRAPFERTQGSLGWRTTLAIFVIATAGLGYAWLDTPGPRDDHSKVVVAPTTVTDRLHDHSLAPVAWADHPARNAAAGSLPPAPTSDALAQAQARVAQIVERLAQGQKAHPADADGWKILGRSYAALGQHAKAVDAFRTALQLRPDDATLLADAAYSAAVVDSNGSSEEPARWIARALQLDPNNRKALALAGTLAVDRKDYAGAANYWEHLARVEPPESQVARELQVSIVQARQLAASARAATATALWAPTPAMMAPPRAHLSGTVTLAPALRARVAPGDAVFVYARPAHGPRMPLVVLRKQVRDLPLRFTLDDSLATYAGATLSDAFSVVVGARIARGGNVLPRTGDLQGQLPAVAVGSDDLKVEIDQIVGAR